MIQRNLIPFKHHMDQIILSQEKGQLNNNLSRVCCVSIKTFLTF